ncbi:unnamed protein product [Klebsiella pneumoniae subsp. rhinoscleromatis SB3432]|nr:unnamed protein product [Klebsiella pneumoniae subsp. rhinoscleromatis SB3432]
MVDSTLDKSAPGPWSGWLHGLLGVLIFSGSLPATRLAVQDMDPLLLTFLRASIAGLLAIALLVGFRQKRPRLAQLVSLIIVSSGVVLGFPLLTALALQRITSAHSIVFIGLLPLMTALFGVLRGGERPRRAFWIFSLLGGGIRPDAKCGGLTQRRSADAGGGYRLRPRLCGRGEADAGARRLAGDLLGAGDCPAVDAPRLAAGSARVLACHLGLLLGGARLCVAVQHADRLHLLVQRAGRGRDRRRRPAPAIAAVLRAWPVGGAVARNRQPLDAGGHAGCGAVRGGLAQIWPPAGWRRERGQQLT